MGKLLKSILLIDDDEATNFFHKLIIREAKCTERVDIATDGKKALDYLTAAAKGLNPIPDLIFLDINMPIMDGWEFLEHYHSLQLDNKKQIALVILSASLNPDDRKKALSYPEVSGFRNKPMNVEMLNGVITEYLS